uniref:Uncharacterized protein n=1 Tax=Aegilops tauschii subsp. strangulata TaxID=200361 RepID=A0A453RK37_AEGTS
GLVKSSRSRTQDWPECRNPNLTRVSPTPSLRCRRRLLAYSLVLQPSPLPPSFLLAYTNLILCPMVASALPSSSPTSDAVAAIALEVVNADEDSVLCPDKVCATGSRRCNLLVVIPSASRFSSGFGIF